MEKVLVMWRARVETLRLKDRQVGRVDHRTHQGREQLRRRHEIYLWELAIRELEAEVKGNET